MRIWANSSWPDVSQRQKNDWHAVDDHSGHVVLKDGRNIILREAVVGVRDEQARLSNSAVADEDTSDA